MKTRFLAVAGVAGAIALATPGSAGAARSSRVTVRPNQTHVTPAARTARKLVVR